MAVTQLKPQGIPGSVYGDFSKNSDPGDDLIYLDGTMTIRLSVGVELAIRPTVAESLTIVQVIDEETTLE